MVHSEQWQHFLAGKMRFLFCLGERLPDARAFLFNPRMFRPVGRIVTGFRLRLEQPPHHKTRLLLFSRIHLAIRHSGQLANQTRRYQIIPLVRRLIELERNVLRVIVDF
ncbi:MAG TPA: hypothetical protein VF988_08160, partial [Verrucomicrobiae bacterium]